MQLGICAIVKHERPHLLEWLAFHKLMGVERVWLAINEDDPTDTLELIAPLIRSGFVVWAYMPGPAKQLAAYYWGRYEAEQLKCRWVAFIDADEFLMPRGEVTVCQALANCPDCAALAINWTMFGASGVVQRPEYVIEANVMRLPHNNGVNKHVKLVAKPERVIEFYDPHAAGFTNEGFAASPAGVKLEGQFQPFTEGPLLLHHYFLRSREDYYDKIERGRADIVIDKDHDHGRNWKYWEMIERDATVRDETALRFLPALKEELAQWQTQYHR